MTYIFIETNKTKSMLSASYGLQNKTLNIAKNQRFDGYQTGLASMVYKRFDNISCSTST